MNQYLQYLTPVGLDSNAPSYLWAILICFVLSCFFAAAETALTALSRVQSERIASKKGWLTSSLNYWIQHPNRLLASVLVGDTLVDTATATLTASFMARYFPHVHIVTVTVVLTFVVLLFGEILPKMIARSYAEQMAPLCARVLIYLNFLLYPFTYAVTTGLARLLKIVGMNLPTDQSIRFGDIEAMVSIVNRQGSEKDRTKILSSVLQFSKRRVKDIMISRDRISAISVDADLMEVLDIVKQENHSRYPVYNESLDRIVGFLHARDLFAILKSYAFTPGMPAKIENFSLRTCLRRAFFVPEQSLISRVLNEMKSNRIHLAIVKDEWGNVVGLITLEDILEQVFGEIEDEHDEHRPQPVVDMYATGIEVAGNDSLLDLSTKYGIDIEPGESYSTVNGFIQHYASHQQLTPKTVIIWKNYVFSIVSAKDGEVERVRITEIPAEKKD